jgi:hypothetical protein
MCQSERIGPLSLPQPQHQIARRDLIGDGKSLAIDLTVAAALRPRLWPKVRADRPLGSVLIWAMFRHLTYGAAYFTNRPLAS